ncbi:MAG: hypothetical protein M3680_06105 [Myxococcota bacterium]|nr:hypothetical protein [Myxococcota bacterium]
MEQLGGRRVDQRWEHDADVERDILGSRRADDDLPSTVRADGAERLAVLSDTGIDLVDIDSGETLRQLGGGGEGWALMPDAKAFVTIRSGGGIRIAEVEVVTIDGETRPDADSLSWRARMERVDQIIWNQEGTTAALRFSDLRRYDGCYRLWDSARGEIIRELPRMEMRRHYRAPSTTARFLDDGATLALIDAQATVWLVCDEETRWKTRLSTMGCTTDWAFKQGRIAQDGDHLVVHASWRRSRGVEPDGYEDFDYRHTIETLRLTDGCSLGEVEQSESARIERESAMIHLPATLQLPEQALTMLCYGELTALGVTPNGQRVLVGTANGTVLEFVEDGQAPR